MFSSLRTHNGLKHLGFSGGVILGLVRKGGGEGLFQLNIVDITDQRQRCPPRVVYYTSSPPRWRNVDRKAWKGPTPALGVVRCHTGRMIGVKISHPGAHVMNDWLAGCEKGGSFLRTHCWGSLGVIQCETADFQMMTEFLVDVVDLELWTRTVCLRAFKRHRKTRERGFCSDCYNGVTDLDVNCRLTQLLCRIRFDFCVFRTTFDISLHSGCTTPPTISLFICSKSW